jgi:hypothetical protein
MDRTTVRLGVGIGIGLMIVGRWMVDLLDMG